MPALNLTPNLSQHDDLYDELIRMHEGLSDAESLRLWARLALILINHIGEPQVTQEAIAAARAI
ncbi:DUF2783 domain-containing protein [Frigidibacter mobilis]|uniref:DUF2783 domain-containing protein n=1 Tax=Frigidibacter mobilis TaxID=1335048 RepID=A0A159Z5R5_9RHOB|nr:DUF2783 domain-containing protein [Frigidibacter mobilis]AMY70605.1 hypothetical protein AKL17_3373 [Frigidibacter mobilis]